MLRNKFYVYGEEHKLKVPSHIHYGKYMLHRFYKYKDMDAIINAETGERLSFGMLCQQVVDIALSLTHMGVRKGDVISLCSEKRLEFVPTLLGVMCAGATFAAMDVTFGKETIEKIVTFGDEEFEGAVSFKEFLTQHAKVEDFFATPVKGWEDVVLILFSSGTTGMPKGVPLTHMNLLLFLGDVEETAFINKSVLLTREWYYSYGLCYTLFALQGGLTVIYCPGGTEVDYLKAIQKYRINLIQLAPATVAELVKSSILDQYDVSSLEGVVSSSTTLDAKLVAAIKTRIPNLKHVWQFYAMSEAGSLCSTQQGSLSTKPGSVGRANNSVIFKIVDLNTREPVGPNQRGEICFKSPCLMKGYIGDSVGDYMDEEGFFKTGDIGYYDDDKCFFIVGRVKELIKFNSYQVAPAELESILLQHESVRAAGVVGAPHPQFGEVPTAFVVLQPGAEVTAEQLVQYVETQVSPKMRLAGGVKFVTSLPRTSSKINRRELLEMLKSNQ